MVMMSNYQSFSNHITKLCISKHPGSYMYDAFIVRSRRTVSEEVMLEIKAKIDNHVILLEGH